ncbi:wax ester/triacylglycerol synthase domain-containing protein [Conexibacter sp. SYSU D00693]|uniref:wax ester/triacylglycerol synthase domain-containing protein n=1 Tax=Conexibacter sp. SYSU D00693 TaxID=2812560 RepID=UPI00196A2602|nr:wax ester/triacylglycerol synthase domain-containing protein [Conexibacter sp. SYSU D00693]
MPRTRLSALDASFLRVESPTAHMHVAWKGRFRPLPGRPLPTLELLRRSIAARVAHAERFRQRLAFPPGGLGEPVWVDDEHFCVEHHVRAFSADDDVLDRRDFDALADRALSEPLDRRRALWRVHLAPRLDDGTVGLVMQVHHAMVDGQSAVELALLLLDVAPDAEVPDTPVAWRPAPAPSPTRLAVEALADAGAESLRAARSAARTARSPRASVRIADTLRRTALTLGEDVLRPAPSSYVNVPIGPRRTLVHHTTALGPLLELRRRLHVTLNDVCLAAVAGAMRELALRGGVAPAPMKVMVPVSRRGADEATDLGNRIAFVFVELPVHLARAADRVAAVHAATSRFKRDDRASGGEALLGALGVLPEPLRDRAARLAASPRMYNMVVSNVQGPRFPVHLLGCELLEAAPVIPLSDGHALSVGIFSHRDTITFGAYADPTALPDVADLPGALSAALLALQGLVSRGRDHGPRLAYVAPEVRDHADGTRFDREPVQALRR